MPALTTPKNGIAEGQHRQFWLPNELIHELLLWVRPSYFWRVRQTLATSAILCPLLMGGKHAITWHQPYDVWTKEMSHANRTFGGGKQFALLCRSHSQALPGNFIRYLQTHSDGTMTVFVLLLLDESKFESPAQLAQAREYFDCSGRSLRGAAFRSLEGIISMSMVRCQREEEFDLVKIKFDANVHMVPMTNTLLELLKLFAQYIDYVLPNEFRGDQQPQNVEGV
ncbi:hypothetical protein niasHS_009172 [Heterodera schachtii]|uniref:Uncharacterized protein n=1 Tax=Heterodera schachtii TaxID=97005 RepID=A0ABD2JE73_HETSC